MQKNLGNNFKGKMANDNQSQVFITRTGRKIFYTGEVDEYGINELIHTLADIEAEDDEIVPQNKLEDFIADVLDIVSTEDKKVNKKHLESFEDVANTYKNNSSFDREPINLYISSRGGEVTEALSFIDYIRLMKTPVWTYAIGKTMSAGLLMLIAGDRRFATLNATVLLHQLSGGIFGTYQKILDEVEEMERTHDIINDLIMLYTNIDEKLLREIEEKNYDYYMSAEQALEFGIIDEII